MKYIISAVKLIVVVALVLFAVFNRGAIDIVIIPDHIVYETYMFVPILGALALGGIVMALAFVKDRMSFNRNMKAMKKTLAEKEGEIARLHNAPLMQDSNNE